MQIMAHEIGLAVRFLSALMAHKLDYSLVAKARQVIEPSAGFDIRDRFDIKHKDIHGALNIQP